MRRARAGLLLAMMAHSGCKSDAVSRSPFEPRTDVIRFVMLPDTQCYARFAPEVFAAQGDWIAENAGRLGFAHVLHAGDVTDTNTPDEWTNAREALAPVFPFVSTTLVSGNHDLGAGGSAGSRASGIDEGFAPEELAVTGTYDGSVQNSYTLVEDEWLMLGLEFAPRADVVAWANEVLDAHDDRWAIVITHAYLADEGARYDRAAPEPQPFAPSEYGVAEQDEVYDGEALWRALVSAHERVVLVLSGHVPQGFGTLVSEGDAGHTVVQLLADYQRGTSCDPDGTDGDGFLIVLEFPRVVGAGDVLARSYSPYLGAYHPHHHLRYRDWRAPAMSRAELGVLASATERGSPSSAPR